MVRGLGRGEGAALAACLLATMRAEDGEPDAEEELRSILAVALEAGDHEVAARAQAALDSTDATI